MSDIFREVDEELRRDRLEKLWKRWGGVLIATAVLLVAATAGYTVWRNWRAATAAEETAQLVSALRLANAPAESQEGEGAGAARAAEALTAVAAEAGDGRELIARLYEAAFRAEAGDHAAATRIYDDLAASDVEPTYRDLALLLSVQHRLQEGDPADLQARLAPLLDSANPWRHSARELSAVLAVRAGDRATAAKAFRELADDPEAPPGIRARANELAAVYAESQ